MPKGQTRCDLRGAESHWFECGCGYRWEGASQPAKNLAFRLHGKRCEIASRCKLSNQNFGHHAVECESKAAFIDKHISELKRMSEVAQPAP